jgi:RNA polymerase sigma-70 factor, ECF subfamily
MSSESQLTVLLDRIGSGDAAAADELFPLIYDELKRKAQYYMAQERPDHTLQATALVNEVYLKLVGGQELAFESREHFFNVASQAMRRLLVDHGRARAAQRRGGGAQRLDVDKIDLAQPEEPDWAALDVALDKLQKLDPRRYQVVMFRYFGGLQEDEIAQILKVTTKTVQRDWKAARMFLLGSMESPT